MYTKILATGDLKLKKNIVYLLIALLLPTVVFGAVYVISNAPINDKDASLYFQAGNMFSSREDHSQAIDNYEKAVALNPRYEEALSNLAISYNKLKLYDKATVPLKRLVELKPENPSYQYDYGVNIVLAIKAKNSGTIEEVEDALAAFRKAEELQPGFEKSQENIDFLVNIKNQYYASE